jgi:hypothetical protein
MHAIHLSPHTVDVAKSVAERGALALIGLGSAITFAILIFVILGWYFWNIG